MAKFLTRIFAGEERQFRLRIGELRELQDRCNAGPATIFTRLVSYQPQATEAKRPRPDDFELGISDPDFIAQLDLYAITRSLGGDWRVDDIRETIRLGLVGAGAGASDATVLVMQYVDGQPLSDNRLLAADIILHALNGEADDPVGKNQAGKATAEMTV